ncbi:MAG: hypothetical protein ABI700_05825 [Chloroflexota bacterium]
MASLRFVLTHKDHPYPEDAISAVEAWGEFTIHSNEDLLLRTEWNLEEFIEWYLETREQRFSSSLPDILPGESLAQASARSRQALQSADDENLSDLLYNFREAHQLYFAFRGSYMPGVMLGINHGHGEISFISTDPKREAHFMELSWIKPGSWAYAFDIPDFSAYMDQHLKDYLREWLTRTNNSDVIANAHRLLDAF